MSNDKNKKQKKIITDEELAKKISDKEDILQKAREPKGQINFIDAQGELKEFDERRQFILNNVDDPAKKYELYYQEVERMLKKIMNVKGADKLTKEAFKIVREEKCIFLTRGKMKNEKGIRGADSRQALIEDLEVAANIIYDNMMIGGNFYNLYNEFKNKNIELGYYNILLGKKSLVYQDDDRLRDIMYVLSEKNRKKKGQ
jgi:hypothetical protein